MERLIIEKLAAGEQISDDDIEQELYEICERVHSSCNDDCPIYRINDCSVPEVGDDCMTFKNGSKMLGFIRLFGSAQN